MAFSRCGLTNALYWGTKISYIRHLIDLFMKYSIPLALFTDIPRSLIFSHFAFLERTRRWSGWPPIDRWWLLLAFNGRSHLGYQLSACWIDDLRSCCWLLGAMSFASSAKNTWLEVSSFSRSFIKSRNRRGHSPEPWATPIIGYLRSRGGPQFRSKCPVL